MKKLLVFLGLLLVVQYGFGQVSNVAELRIQNATTPFGKNLSIANKIFNLADSTYYAVTAPIASTATITTGIANLYRIDGRLDSLALDGTTLKIYQNGWATPFSVDLSGIIPGAQDLSYNSGTHSIDISGGGDSAIIPLAVDDGATEGLASFTAADFNVTAGNVAIDYANGQKATNAQPGFATAAHITAIEANTAKIGVTDGDKGDITIGSSGTTYTIDSDAVTYSKIQNVVGNDVLLGNNSGAGGVVEELTASDVRTILNVADGAQVNYIPRSQTFTEDDGTPTAHSLTYTAVTSGATVTQNGAVVPPANYTLTTTTLTLSTVVYQYDEVIIYYNSTN